MDTAEIDRLLRPFARLDKQQLAHTSMYIDLLVKWNARMNLTAVRTPAEMVTRHFGESFFVAETLKSNRPVSLIDLGSGAGFPGIPIAMLLPGTQVTLIESNQKKSTFLREVIFALKLENVSVFTGRGEDCTLRADLVAMRAVERFARALPIAVNLVGKKGQIALMIGASQAPAARALTAEVEWRDGISIPGGQSRILLAGARKTKVE